MLEPVEFFQTPKTLVICRKFRSRVLFFDRLRERSSADFRLKEIQNLVTISVSHYWWTIEELAGGRWTARCENWEHAGSPRYRYLVAVISVALDLAGISSSLAQRFSFPPLPHFLSSLNSLGSKAEATVDNDETTPSNFLFLKVFHSSFRGDRSRRQRPPDDLIWG